MQAKYSYFLAISERLGEFEIKVGDEVLDFLEILYPVLNFL